MTVRRIKISDEEIVENAKIYTYEEVAEKFKISGSSVFNIASRYGVRKKPGRIKGKLRLIFAPESEV